jgi:hypothetical protein
MLTDMQQRQVALVVDRKVLLERLEKKIASEPRKNLWSLQGGQHRKPNYRMVI